jgi:GDP/UDP-N,N'-diacetylbacillosamine 2-epimerase (hydrolysing)
MSTPVPPKRVAVLTGIRSEYDILYSVLREIQDHPQLELQVIVAGTHLSPRFCYSVRQIEADGFPIVERLETLLDSDSAASRVKSAAIQLMGLVQTLERIKPDFLLVCGDREESMMAGVAGSYMNIPVAHIAGGDIVIGNVDDSVRHAVTKLAHLHFTLSEESAERVRKMGEEPWRVHCVGNPGLDRFRLLPKLSREELGARLGIELKGPVLLVIQHTISSEIGQGADQMKITFEALAEMGYTALIGYPNSDAGSREMIEVIDTFSAKHPFLKLYRNLPRLEFLSLLQTADVLVGNSSLGILEAPFLKLPVVNIGNRQKLREHAENVTYVPHDRAAIVKAVRDSIANRTEIAARTTCPFGDGYSAVRIADILAATPVDDKLKIKGWAY